MFDHQDLFSPLNAELPLQEKLEFIHDFLKGRFKFIDRIAVVIYDPKTDLLKTYMHSSGGDSPLSLYSARLADSPSLQKILEMGHPRVVNDMDVFERAPSEHSRRIAAQKYGSSYTMPMLHNGEFFGFLFFNSYRKYAFDETMLRYLDVVGHLLALLVINELIALRNLLATVHTALNVVQQRDFETGAHLDRVSNYARLIAKEVAHLHQLSDDLVEHISLFSPLHDIGKIGIPDSILLKPASLTEAEFDTMKTHTSKGGEIVCTMLENLKLSDLPQAVLLRNIVLHHHEALNGSGYNGLLAAQIPIEAKIVAVADVFDALTSVRPYKDAWSNDKAFEFIQSMAGSKFDSDCVAALIKCRAEIEAIQEKFKDD
jgi:HD-GYP domain-containing protein (c-di-GMP phosphodiesterase class II)